MEVKLLPAAVLLMLVSTLTGIDAQLNVCGIAPLNNNMIVVGQNAAEGEWPWQASIHISNRFTCGGSLINNQWVMTAADCFDSTRTVGVTVYLGRHTQAGGPNPNEQSRTVIQIIIHPRYNPTTFNNDIALVKLSSPVRFTNYIRPVCLAANDRAYKVGTNTTVTGWGRIQTNKNLSRNEPLQEVEVPVVSNDQCKKIHRNITDNMICAGVFSGGKGICNSNPGGPLVTKSGSRWIQGGVVSFGRGGCAATNTLGVYTRVSVYESWIWEIIFSPPSPPYPPYPPYPSYPSSIFSASSSVGPATGVFLTVLLSLYVLS